MAKTDPNTIGLATTRRILAERGWSCAAFARMVGVTRQRMWDLLNAVGEPRSDITIPVADFLGFPRGDWLEHYDGNVLLDYPLEDGYIAGPGRGHREKVLTATATGHRKLKRVEEHAQKVTARGGQSVRGERTTKNAPTKSRGRKSSTDRG